MLFLADQSTPSSRLDRHQNVTFYPELFIQTACAVIHCSGTGLCEWETRKKKNMGPQDICLRVQCLQSKLGESWIDVRLASKILTSTLLEKAWKLPPDVQTLTFICTFPTSGLLLAWAWHLKTEDISSNLSVPSANAWKHSQYVCFCDLFI